MYVPAHFQPPNDQAVVDLLHHHGAADLITATNDGMLATLLPFIYEAPNDARPHGTLLGHVARNNPQWQQRALGEALVIMRGPDSYISPNWYASKAEHGRVVPTWNYVTAHIYGELRIHDDSDWVEALVRRLTDHHESSQLRPWSVGDAPERYVRGQLRAIVGVELVISRVEAKFKLSQNRSEGDVDGVIAGLTAVGDSAGAAAVEQARSIGRTGSAD